MKKLFRFVKKIVLENNFLILLLIFYFAIRIYNLTKFPIFNDEAIYLDWGWREINNPGYLYYSLYDAKQPLLMWIFGIMQNVLSDPLLAGRIVSVFCGFISILGIYKLSEKLFDKKIALYSSLLYVLIPIFSFFDRQALMESAICTVGIWSGYFVINLFDKKNFKDAIFLGITLGIGFFIKSSSFLFLLSFLILSIYLFKISSKKAKVFEIIITTLLVFSSIIFLLLINPLFWDTLKTNSRFTLTLNELFTFPFSTWVTSILINLRILVFYLTPIVIIFVVFGIYSSFKLKRNYRIFIVFYLIPIFIETLTVRGATDRYLVSYLPFLVIPAAFALNLLLSKFSKLVGYVALFILLVIPFSLTLYQDINQAEYMQLMQRISGYGNLSYLMSSTSGYGMEEIINYFNQASAHKNIIIGIAENTGNPESAVNIYFNKNKNIKVVYFDARLFNIDLSKLDCLQVDSPTYFVSRDDQLVGLDKFLVKDKTIRNPYGINTIGIYKLKTNCKGNSFKLELKRTT